jgi:hypothetical protein
VSARLRMSAAEYIDHTVNTPPRTRAKSKRPEDLFHTLVARWLTEAIAPAGKRSKHGVLWFSVETRGKRSLAEGARNKARGCIAGVPDIDIYHQGRAFKIELKAPKGTSTDTQVRLHHELVQCGVPVLVARELDMIMSALTEWGIPWASCL